MAEVVIGGELDRFRAAIIRCFGLTTDDSRLGDLASLFARRLEATGKPSSAYLERLETCDAREELRLLAQELTVGETYFFRSAAQFRAFVDIALLPAQRPLRILSAGCASGEEAYSLAMIARERERKVQIRAVDLNPAALRKAGRGHYSSWSLRETPSDMRRHWFRDENGEMVLDSTLRSSVTFEERNLTVDDAELWRPGGYDVVFCRNVLMYFTREAAQAVVARISRSLAPNGYLFLGHAETLRGLSSSFHLMHTHDTFYYQRHNGTERAEYSPSSPATADAAPELPWAETVQRSTDRIRALSLESESEPMSAPGRAVELGVAFELLRQERFEEALLQLKKLPLHAARDPDTLLLYAALLTHSGSLQLAEKACVDLLGIDDLNAGANYLLALCREGQGDWKGAVNHDQVAIYLDPSFVMPRLHLGLMARRHGDRDTALRELTEALRLLPFEDASRLLLLGGGFNRQALIALCGAELANLARVT